MTHRPGRQPAGPAGPTGAAPRVVPLGDTGILVDGVDGPAAAGRLAALGLTGVEEVVATATAVTVVVDPDGVDSGRLTGRIAAVLGDLATPAPAPAGDEPPLTVPVRFDGPDLVEVADRLGTEPTGVVDLLVASELTVAFLGFAPGFAYLTGLPPSLATLERRAAPRIRVPAGSVAVAGGYAAVYPHASPGGWNLLGTTSLPMFDRHVPPYARLRPGRRVRFAVDPGPPRPAAAPPRRRRLTATGRRVVVESPGLATTVQDGGRLGLADVGVPRAGPADALAHLVANRLVGNDDRAAALEITAQGPVLQVVADTVAAVVGDAPVTVDGLPVPGAAPVPVRAGQRLAVGRCRAGARAVLALAGGVLGPTEVGSRASDQLCGLGPGPLRAGDELAVGPPGRPAGRLVVAGLAGGPLDRWARLVGLVPDDGTGPSGPAELRVVPGPDRGDDLTWLAGGVWEVDEASDRVGVRLRPAPSHGATGATRGAGTHLPGSRGVVTGAVQLPPGGRPVVLLCDHATVGGYPVVATVASVDVAVLAQLWPGRPVRLLPVDVDVAVAARRRAMAVLDDAVRGRYPTATA